MIRICLLLIFCLSLSAYGQTDSSDNKTTEEIFLKFNYANIVDVIIPSCYKDGKVYIPFETTLNSLQISVISGSEGETFRGFLIDKDSTYEINFISRTAAYHKKTIALNSSDFVKFKNVYYVLPEVLKHFLNLDFSVNFNNQTLSLSTPLKIQALTDMERERTRIGLKYYKNPIEVPLIYDRKRRWIQMGYIDYNISANSTRNSKPFYAYDLAVGSHVAGGEFDGYVKGAFEDEILKGNLNASFIWRYALNQNKFLNQIDLGRITSNGLFPLQFDGLRISNTPASPRISFDNYVVRDKTEPNSDVEVYINNQLYDYKKADELGNFSFQIPLTYGSNTITLKIYGPHGEIIEHDKRIQVPGNFIPAGEINYDLSYGKTTDTREYMYQANVMGGITDWLTNNVGVDYLRESANGKPLFYNSLSARIFSEYLFNYTVAPDLYHKVSLNAFYFSQVSFGLIYTKYKQNSYYNILNLDNSINATAFVPVNIGPVTSSSQFRGDYSEYQFLKLYNYVFEQSFEWNGNRPFVSYRYTKGDDVSNSFSSKFLTFGLFTTLPILYKLLPVLSGNMFSVSTDYNYNDKKFQSLALSFATNISRFVRSQFNFSRNYLIGETDYNFQLTIDLSFIKSYATAGKNSVNTTLQGSLGFDLPNDRVIMYNRQLTGSSAVVFRMYLDKNGNGKYDKKIDEILTDDIGVDLKEGVTYERGGDNLLRVTNLIPNLEYSVVIKDDKLRNPNLVPKYKNFSFIADPNVFKEIDVPFYYTSEINGSVTVISKDRTVEIPGVTVSIINDLTGDIINLTTFSDGSFYNIGLLPGKYSAYVDPAIVKKYNARSEPQRISFELKGNKTQVIKDLKFVLRI